MEPISQELLSQLEGSSLNVAGKEYPINEVLELASKGVGFTQKTQAHATEVEAFKSQVEQFNQSYGAFADAFENDPEYRAEINEVTQKRFGGAPPDSGTGEPATPAAPTQSDPALMDMLRQVAQSVEGVNTRLARVEVGNDLDAMARTHDDWDEVKDEVLAYASEHGMDDVQAAYKQYTAEQFDPEAERMKITQDILQGARENGIADLPNFDVTRSGDPKFDPRGKSKGQIREEALNRMSGI